MLLKLKLAGPNPTKQARKSVLTLRNNVFLSVVFNFFRRNNSVLHNALLKAEWVDGMSWYPNHQDSYYATIAHWFPGIQQLNVYLFDPLRHISLNLYRMQDGGCDSHFHKSLLYSLVQKVTLPKANQDSRVSYTVWTYSEGSVLWQDGDGHLHTRTLLSPNLPLLFLWHFLLKWWFLSDPHCPEKGLVCCENNWFQRPML